MRSFGTSFFRGSETICEHFVPGAGGYLQEKINYQIFAYIDWIFIQVVSRYVLVYAAANRVRNRRQ